MALLCLPLGVLPYLGAVACWMIGGCLVFLLTVLCAWPRKAPRVFDVVLYSLAIPAVIMNVKFGQTGTWVAAVLGFGLMTLERRPVVSGILLGLMVAKPQLGLLIPIALIAGRRWTALVSAAATAATLIAATVAWFGMAPWWAFVERMPVLQQRILEDGSGVWQLFTSVFVAVRHLPASVTAAYAAQAAAAVVAAVLVGWCWSREVPQSAKNAALMMGLFFATPYAHVYDLVATALVPLWLWQAMPSKGPRRGVGLLAFTVLILAPSLMTLAVVGFGVSIGFLLLLPAFVYAVYICLRSKRHGDARSSMNVVGATGIEPVTPPV